MAKIKIQFSEDFATHKKGDVLVLDSLLASDLIRFDKVAKEVVITNEVPKVKVKNTTK
jgi:hypothetical protein